MRAHWQCAAVFASAVLAGPFFFCQAVAQKQGTPTPETLVVPDDTHLETTVNQYQKALVSPPPNATQKEIDETRLRLATAHFLLHRYEESLKDLEPLESTGRDRMSAQAWAVKGLDELELNRLGEAIHSLQRATFANPGSATTRLALGDAFARGGRMEEARQEYEKQTELTPTLADAWYKLGLVHSQTSVEASREEVRGEERDLIQQLNAEELLAKGDALHAARVLLRLVRQSSVRPEVHAELGTALLTLGYVRAAQDHFNQELARNPESPLARLGLVQTAALGGDWTQVKIRLEQLCQSHPRELIRLMETPPTGLILQASATGEMKPSQSFVRSPAGALWTSWLSDTSEIARLSSARKEKSQSPCDLSKDQAAGNWLTEDCYSVFIRRANREIHLSENAQIKLTEAEFRSGQYKAALISATRLRRAHPRSGWGIYWLSKSHDAIAEECFLKIGALNPDSPRVHQMLAEHYLKLSDYPKARSEFQSALRLSPNSPDLHLGLGTVLSRSSDWPEAEKELKTTLELAPNSSFAHYELGHVYVQQSQWARAIEHLRQVADDSTVLLSARLDLSKAEAEAGQDGQAIRDLLSVAALDQDGELYFRLAGIYRSTGDQAKAREALATFKQRRAASLQADTQELGALEKEQELSSADQLQVP